MIEAKLLKNEMDHLKSKISPMKKLLMKEFNLI